MYVMKNLDSPSLGQLEESLLTFIARMHRWRVGVVNRNVLYGGVARMRLEEESVASIDVLSTTASNFDARNASPLSCPPPPSLMEHRSTATLNPLNGANTLRISPWIQAEPMGAHRWW